MFYCMKILIQIQKKSQNSLNESTGWEQTNNNYEKKLECDFSVHCIENSKMCTLTHNTFWPLLIRHDIKKLKVHIPITTIEEFRRHKFPIKK